MTSRLSLVVATTLGLATGLIGGYFALQPRCDRPAGHLWSVGPDTFVDGPVVDLLASKLVHESAGEWTLFVLRKFGIFLKKVSDRPLLPGQLGPLYQIRDEADASRNDDDVQVFLSELVRLGVLQRGRRFRSWDDAREAV